MNLENGRTPDPIEPAYYRDLSPEPMEVIAAWRLCFRLGAVVKYIARWEKKGGVEDLKKARWYLSHLIDELERKEHGQVVATNATGS